MSNDFAHSAGSRVRRAQASAEPIPLVVVRREGVSERMLGELLADKRFEAFETSALRPDWVQLANGAAALVIISHDDPLSALGYAVTAGVRTRVFVAGKPRFRARARDLKAAGGSGFLNLPLRRSDLDRLARELASGSTSHLIAHDLRVLLDPIARVARYRDQTVHLTQREFALLHCLSSYGGRPVAADELYRHVWGEETSDQSQGILAVYVFQLRQKLARLGLAKAVKTVRRFGYALVHDDGTEPR